MVHAQFTDILNHSEYQRNPYQQTITNPIERRWGRGGA